MKHLQIFIFIVLLSFFVSEYQNEIFTIIYQFHTSMTLSIYVNVVLWIALSISLMFTIFSEIEANYPTDFLSVLLHASTLLVQYAFFYAMMAHGGIQHGVELHMIEEKFYVILWIFNIINVLSLFKHNKVNN